MSQENINFLREYHCFTSKHFVSIARVVADRASRVRTELSQTKFREENVRLGDELGHLISHLYVLNYMQIEAFCAFLYALINPKKSMLSALLSFDIKKHGAFIKKLKREEFSLENFGFQVPAKDHNADSYNQANKQLKEHLRRFANILDEEDMLRWTYNKLKHGAVVVRHPNVLYAEEEAMNLSSNAVFIPINKPKGSQNISRIPLSAEEGKPPPEYIYLKHIEYITTLSKDFSRAASESLRGDKDET